MKPQIITDDLGQNLNEIGVNPCLSAVKFLRFQGKVFDAASLTYFVYQFTAKSRTLRRVAARTRRNADGQPLKFS